MAISVRNELDEIVAALINAVNALQDNGAVADGYHRDLTQVTSGNPLRPDTIVLTTLQVTAPLAVDLASTIVMANNIRGVLITHFGDAQAHKVADSTDLNAPSGILGTSPAVDLASVITLLNTEKSLYNAHLTQVVSGTQVHVNNDTGTTVTEPNASDLSTAEQLAIALQGSINVHILNAKASSHNSPRINLVSA